MDPDPLLYKIDIAIKEKAWLNLCSKKQWQRYFDFVLHIIFKFIKKTSFYEISFLLTHDKEMQNLNNLYRGINKPTNVLSFPMEEKKGPNEKYILLGDIILSWETIVKEAQIHEKILQYYIMHLVAHGVLHLFGYDHIHEKEAQLMSSLETEILEQFKQMTLDK
ncbi:MAG: rRNA maturation RNase YbeY [Alphaproteobacteria bacterium]